MSAYYSVDFRPGSDPQDRRVLYRNAWGFGYRKSPRRRRSSAITFFPRRPGVSSGALENLLSVSPAVAEWQRLEEFV